ncbi:STAS domain-containing protein [Alteribacillus iranensis]|uniref:RsbT co-antagonist protein RsbR n=1 Tax=Alteribacillus iranensis TaxID=930128 RepID=A0A1I2DG70_9BACI|nr:STAS domain-containing protein [Alteribacillus iranensis]SFE78940.1 rsbT co-antagonist protein RsbR [Alteribacillus iranensis]
MQPSIVEMIYTQKQDIISDWLSEINNVMPSGLAKKIPNEASDETNKKFVELIIESLELTEEAATEKLNEFAQHLIYLGWPLSYFTQGMQAFRRVLLETMSSMESISSKKVFETFYEIETWVDSIINQIADEYSGSWESTIHLQRMALKELSAPLIPVFEKVSVMPLVGTIDTERAKLIMENVLDGIIEHRSQVVLIDITGVPVVDTMVAHHLIQTAEAIRLVGAECILVGIRPEIAQTIVNLGIDLSKFRTKSSLRRGVETGLELTQRKIIKIENDDERIDSR